VLHLLSVGNGRRGGQPLSGVGDRAGAGGRARQNEKRDQKLKTHIGAELADEAEQNYTQRWRRACLKIMSRWDRDGR